jgi:hypothetical protein
VDAGGGGQLDLDAPVEQPHPAQRQERLGGRREGHDAHGRQPLQRDVGLEEAVEEHHPLRAGLPELDHQVGQGGEVGRELDGDGDLHRAADLPHDVEVALLHLGRAHLGIGLHRVEVDLQRVGAGRGDLLGVAGPAARRAAVQAGDDRDVERLLGALHQREVLVRPDALGREVGARLRAGVGVARRRLLELGVAGLELFLEEGAQHHRPGAVSLRGLQVLDPVGERRGGDHQRARQAEAKVVRRQVGHVFSRLGPYR